jgi:hypothetical protein
MILDIKKPEDLFSSSSIPNLKKEYHTLALKYHPDLNKEKDALAIFEHIKALYETALVKIKSSTWEGRGTLFLQTKNTIPSEIRYYRMYSMGAIGNAYISDNFVLYLIKKDYSRFYDRARNMLLLSVQPRTKKLTDEFKKFLPSKVEYLEMENGDFGLKIPKTEHTYSLSDILRYYNGRLDPRHVAWILSSLYNLNCYLEHQDIVHYDLSLESYLIAPATHTGFLLGGWWHSYILKEKVTEVPQKTFELIPHLCKNPDNSIMRELIRSIGRELLGDPKGIKLKSSAVPEPMAKWLKGVSTAKNAIEEFKMWDACLLHSFGKRKFMPMDISNKQITRR